ncbi:MAG: hypothetical protein V4620_07995 [Bacteroidota bacterium]
MIRVKMRPYRPITLATISITILCLLMGFSLANKPSLKTFTDLQKLSEKMAQKRYSSQVRLTLYASTESNEVLETRSMEINVWDNFYHYKTDEMEAFANNQVSISINHSKKIILVNPNTKTKKTTYTEQILPFIMDTGQNQLFTKSLVSSADGIKTYKFKSQLDDSNVDQLLFKIDTKQVKPISCEIYYANNLDKLLGKIKKGNNKQKPRMYMEYPTFEYPQKCNPDLFSFSHILRIDKANNVQLSNKYKNYELINYLKRNK